MQKQFEFRPFDRVTVDYNGAKMPGAIMCDLPDNWFTVCYESKAHRYLTNPFCADQIRPGHYDADGNWLPYPGEPCYVVKSNELAFFVVVDVSDDYFIVMNKETESAHEFAIFKNCGVAYPWRNNIEAPEYAKIYPGRIKTAEQ